MLFHYLNSPHKTSTFFCYCCCCCQLHFHSWFLLVQNSYYRMTWLYLRSVGLHTSIFFSWRQVMWSLSQIPFSPCKMTTSQIVQAATEKYSKTTAKYYSWLSALACPRDNVKFSLAGWQLHWKDLQFPLNILVLYF